MIAACPVEGCTGTRHQGWGVCKGCAAALTRYLAEIPALQTELAIQVARLAQGRQNGAQRLAGASAPLPMDVRASDRAWLLRNTLVGWIRDLEPDPARQPVDDLAAMARWLLARQGQLYVHPAADELVAEVRYAVGQAWAAVDQPAERVFLGTCPAIDQGGVCEAELWAPMDAIRVRCRGCAVVHDPAALRVGLHLRLAGHLVTGVEFAGYAVRYLGVRPSEQDRLEDRVRQWASRGRVVAVGRQQRPDGPAVPTYRFGDLAERLEVGRRTA